jgi:hypothetical protein
MHLIRSFTDPLTNVSVLSGEEFELALPHLLKTLSLPKTLQSTFIHELTHHWCFSTAIGYVQALLRLRMQRRATAIGTAAFDFRGFMADFIRYEAITALLRPFSEGMALFAEFDVTPSDAQASFPFVVALMFFGQEDLKSRYLSDSRGDAQLWFDFLYESRMTNQLIEKKASLLCAPLSSQTGGYLQGYLTVKNLRNMASENLGTIIDSDTFLYFIRGYVYNDFGLVLTVLEDYKDPSVLATSIGRYIWDRFVSVAGMDLRQALSQAKLGTQRNWYEGNNPLASTPTDTFDAGYRALKALEADISTKDDVISLLHRIVAFRRTLFSIGSIVVDYYVNDAHSIDVAYNGRKYIFVPKTEAGAIRRSGKGTLDVFFHQFSLIICLSSGRQVIGLNYIGELDEKLLDSLHQIPYQRDAILAHSKELDKLTDIVTKEDSSPTKHDVRNIQRGFLEAADNIYNPLALLLVSEGSKADCSDRMRASGFYGLLEKGGDRGHQIRQIASMGIHASLLASPAAVSMREVQLDEATVTAVVDLQAKYGPIIFTGLEEGHIQYSV